MADMTSVRFTGPSRKLGEARQAEELSAWDETWLNDGAPTKLLKKLGKGSLLLDTLEYDIFPQGTARASFTPKDEFGLGRDIGKHPIEFGQMILNGPGVHELPELVAIKTLDSIEQLKHEWAISQYLNGVFEDQFALLPLGIHRNEDGNFSIITVYEHGIQTGDQTFWADYGTEPEALRPENIRKTFAMGILGLGMFHGARVIHGDAEAKNLAFDRSGPRAVDLEDAAIIPHADMDSDRLPAATRQELDAYISSTVQVDENRKMVADALSSPQMIKYAQQQYTNGVRLGRLSQSGHYVPPIELQNADHIAAKIEKLKK